MTEQTYDSDQPERDPAEQGIDPDLGLAPDSELDPDSEAGQEARDSDSPEPLPS